MVDVNGLAKIVESENILESPDVLNEYIGETLSPLLAVLLWLTSPGLRRSSGSIQ